MRSKAIQCRVSSISDGSPDGIADGFGLDSCEEFPRLLAVPLVERVAPLDELPPPLPLVSDMICLSVCWS